MADGNLPATDPLIDRDKLVLQTRIEPTPHPPNNVIPNEVNPDALADTTSVASDSDTSDDLVGEIRVTWKSHFSYRKYKFPYEECHTWAGFKALLCSGRRSNDHDLLDIDNDDFDVMDTAGSIIVPQAWESLIRSGMVLIATSFSFLGDPLSTMSAKNTLPSPPTLPPVPLRPPPLLYKPPHFHPPWPAPFSVTQGKDDELEETGTMSSKSMLHSVSYHTKASWWDEEKHFYTKPYNGIVVNERRGGDSGGSVVVLEEVLKVYRAGSSKPRFNEPMDDPGFHTEHALVQADDQIRGRDLVIHSETLLNVLRAVTTYTRHSATDEESGLVNGRFTYPFPDIFHYTEDLRLYKIGHPSRGRHTEAENQICDSHIDLLLDHLYGLDKVGLEQAEERWKRKVPTTTFSQYWLLLKPGTDVYVENEELGGYDAAVIESFGGGPMILTGRITQPYTILVWGNRFNGNTIDRYAWEITIELFDGEREIHSLPLYPCRFHIDEHGQRSLYAQLVERGKKYFELCKGPAYREYTGKGKDKKEYEKTRIIVDKNFSPSPPPSSPSAEDLDRLIPPHLRRNSRSPPIPPHLSPGSGARVPACGCEVCTKHRDLIEGSVHKPFGSYDLVDPKRPKEIVDHQYLLCPPTIEAYILKNREYDIVEVDKIGQASFQPNAIERLVLKDDSLKTTLKATCHAHTKRINAQDAPYYADLISGKGEGNIILLHGPPGSGKTFTAEAFSEDQQRPLLSITAADLGHKPTELEKNLLSFFQKAMRWDGIVLLDEADVYLEERKSHDLGRNSIVSVFLRAFDYFKGTLFLTTNRVGEFDEAFLSRIHLQIRYEQLNDEGRSKVWNNHFLKLREDHEKGGREIVYDYDAKEYVLRSSEVRELKWNGREIRNAFQTAVSLAIYEATQKNETPVKIYDHHFQQVVRMSAAFRAYIKATHNNQEESDRAFSRSLRDDSFLEK